MDSEAAQHEPHVTLVIPGRNCAATIRHCLDAVIAIQQLSNSPLREIIFVNDNSNDATPQLVTSYDSVRLLDGPGRGPAAARNIGWQSASNPLIWFIDSDCIAEPDALDRLLSHLDDPDVGAVGGSYDIVNDQSRLARLIHEEIIERHRRMTREVDVLASFNVLYRRKALQDVGGFDERYIVAEDAQLSIAVRNADYTLRFEPASLVGHYHPERLRGYLRTQARHGYWRTIGHLEQHGQTTGNSYSSVLDHIQPVLAMALLAAIFLPIGALLFPKAVFILLAVPIVLLLLLIAATLPMTLRLIQRTRRLEMLWYAPLSAVRAIWRGVGMTCGVVQYTLFRKHHPQPVPGAAQT